MKAKRPLIVAAVGGALIAGLLWVWPFASIREGRSADVGAAVSTAETLDARLVALQEAAVAANDTEAAEHLRFSAALDESLVSVLDSEALIAWAQTEDPDGDAPVAFLNAAEARWRAETQVAAGLLANFSTGVSEVSVSDPQPVEGLDGLEMAGTSFRVAVDSLEEAITLALALDSRPDVVLDEVRVNPDDGPLGTGLWWVELNLRWYRLPETLAPR